MSCVAATTAKLNVGGVPAVKNSHVNFCVFNWFVLVVNQFDRYLADAANVRCIAERSRRTPTECLASGAALFDSVPVECLLVVVGDDRV